MLPRMSSMQWIQMTTSPMCIMMCDCTGTVCAYVTVVVGIVVSNHEVLVLAITFDFSR